MPILKSDKGDYVIISCRYSISYFDVCNNEFIIDSEMVNSPVYDFVISSKSITTRMGNLSEKEKQGIIWRVNEICNNHNIKLLITE